MERNANNSLSGYGGKHEPVNYLNHLKNEAIIKAQERNKAMSVQQNMDNFDDIDASISIVSGERRRASSNQGKAQGRFLYQDNTSSTARTISAGRYESMRANSTTGAPIKNRRQKAQTNKLWQKAAIAATISATIFVGGVLNSDSILGKLEQWQKEWELHNNTKSFEQMVEQKYSKKTITEDTRIEYDKIAEELEEDGFIDNRELYNMVASIGEENANRVLAVANNAPADTVEQYMDDNNIVSIKDWKDKTAKAMVAEEKIETAQAELDAIFKDASDNTNRNTHNSNATYGGK